MAWTQRRRYHGVVPEAAMSTGRIAAAFRGRRRIALMPFVAAGFPDLDTSEAVLSALPSAGADLIEIGFPFSDPIADGPTIQEAFSVALARGVRVSDVLAMVRRVRHAVTAPLLGMLSYSIVYRHGPTRFFAAAREAGLDGLILPDLPPPEAAEVCAAIRSQGLDTVLLIAPTSDDERRRTIGSLSSGFVYYLSVSGITGERTGLPSDVLESVRRTKALTDRPVCVGFGLSRAAQVASLSGVADGAIVGSALVRRVRDAGGGPASVRAATEFCAELLSDVGI